jgi:Zn-dependent protease
MKELVIFLAAMFLHELGHSSMALVLEVKVYRIGWKLWGMTTEMDLPVNYAEFAFVTIAGPIVSIAFFLLACVEGWNSFALANACILAACFLPGGDFFRLFQYDELRVRAQVNRYLLAVCQ